MMRVLIVCPSSAWGGLERVVLDDAIGLSGLGLDVFLLCREDSELAKQAVLRGVVVIHVPDYRFPRLLNWFDWRLIAIVRSLINNARLDVIHTHLPSLIGSLVPALWFLPSGVSRPKFFVSRHLMSGHDKNDPWHRFFFRFVDRFWVMGRAIQVSVQRTHPVAPQKVQILPLGIDFEKFSTPIAPLRKEELRRSWGIQSDSFVIACAGRIDPAKGQRELLEAFHLLTQESSEKYSLVFFGETTRGRSENYCDSLENRIQELKLANRAKVLGFTESISESLHACDVHVMPSHEEAFGLVTLEAMAARVPVIVSARGSGPDLVGSGQERGVMVDCGNAMALARSIRELRSSIQASDQRVNSAYLWVKDNYDRHVRYKRTAEAYRTDRS